MKTDLIKEGDIYIAIIKGNEVRVRADLVNLDYIVGTDIDKQRGIIVHTSKVVAGPLKEIDSRLSERKYRL